jgi:hypothetical protein
MARLTSLIWLGALFISCKKDPEFPTKSDAIPKAVIVVIDGVRWTESWGDPNYSYIPSQADSMQYFGSWLEYFYNNGETFTIPGHAALFSGVYQNLANDGTQFSDYPTLFQLYLQTYASVSGKAKIIASKDKIEILKNSNHVNYINRFVCETDCGASGNGSGYRADSTTARLAKYCIQNEHPDLLFIHLREPDYSGHTGTFNDYLNGLRQADYYAFEIFKWVKNEPYYSNAFFAITNDHGRHLNNVSNAYVSHGDTCAGCRRIGLYVSGPGIKKNFRSIKPYEQIDFFQSLCEWLKLPNPEGRGKIIYDIME